jgi:hypothetical protein
LGLRGLGLVFGRRESDADFATMLLDDRAETVSILLIVMIRFRFSKDLLN